MRVQSLLADLADSARDPLEVARSLRGARLLTAVVAVLDAADVDGADKDSHMAVVSMLNNRGERGLLAFSGIGALTAWDPTARPVPALGRDVARAALDDGALAVVVDVAGPRTAAVEGRALDVLADTLDLAAVAPLVHAALAPLTSDGWVEAAVDDAREGGAADVGIDLLVTMTVPASGHPDGRRAEVLAEQAASMLAARTDIQRLVPGGIGVTLAARGPQ